MTGAAIWPDARPDTRPDSKPIVLVTGAAGNRGRSVAEALAGIQERYGNRNRLRV